MPVRTIRLLGDEILWTPSLPVPIPPDQASLRVAEDLADTLEDFRIANGFGRGIAAPQIGHPVRIIVMNFGIPITLFNPVIIRKSREMMTLWDDCFSFPDLKVKVRRHVTVSVEYLDATGVQKTIDAEGGRSELLQHEIDHLDGILAIDRAIDLRHIILRSEWQKRADAQRDQPIQL